MEKNEIALRKIQTYLAKITSETFSGEEKRIWRNRLLVAIYKEGRAGRNVDKLTVNIKTKREQDCSTQCYITRGRNVVISHPSWLTLL